MSFAILLHLLNVMSISSFLIWSLIPVYLVRLLIASCNFCGDAKVSIMSFAYMRIFVFPFFMAFGISLQCEIGVGLWSLPRGLCWFDFPQAVAVVTYCYVHAGSYHYHVSHCMVWSGFSCELLEKFASVQ
jgi:hypothetical protein